MTDATHEHAGIVGAHHRRARSRRWLLATLAFLAIAAFLIDLTVGASDLTVATLVRALIDPGALTGIQQVIVWDIRLPSSLIAVLVGLCLGLAGAEMQTVLNNPLASPFTLGVSSAASFGASLAIVFSVSFSFATGSMMVSLFAFAFAAGSVLLLQALSRLTGRAVHTLVLFGVALQFSFTAMIAILQVFASQQALQQIVFWMLGSLDRAAWDQVAILAVVATVGLALALRGAPALTLMQMGEDRAAGFGIDVRRLKARTLLRVSLLTGTAVAFVGTIGFIGLVGPHIARLLLGGDHRYLLPASALTGALLLTVASILSKSILTGVTFPVGAITAILGVPVFIALIVHRSRMP